MVIAVRPETNHGQFTFISSKPDEFLFVRLVYSAQTWNDRKVRDDVAIKLQLHM